jgi:hypothetical protein
VVNKHQTYRWPERLLGRRSRSGRRWLDLGLGSLLLRDMDLLLWRWLRDNLRLGLGLRLLQHLNWRRYRLLNDLWYLLDGGSHVRGGGVGVRRGWGVRHGRRDDGRCGRRWWVVWRRDDGGVLRGAAIGLLHRHKVLHPRRRPNISGVGGIGHVAGWAGHGAVLVGRRHVVLGAGVGVRHVVGRVHWLGDVLVLVVVVVGVMVGMGWLVVLRPASATRRRAAGGRGAHVGDPLHLLPSRQMPAIVHHAGVGFDVLCLLR